MVKIHPENRFQSRKLINVRLFHYHNTDNCLVKEWWKKYIDYIAKSFDDNALLGWLFKIKSK